MKPLLRVAHRGLSGLYPENTIEAFEAALRYHPEMIELDLQLTRDGQVIVFHDETLDRMAGRPGWIKDFTYSELRSLPVRIPLFSEYLELTKGTGVETFVELKNSFIPYPGLAEKAVAQVAEAGRTGDCIFFSGNHRSAIHCRTLDPALRICFNFDHWLFDEGAYCKKYGVHYAIPYHLSLTEDIVRDFHRNEVMVFPWTVDTAEEAEAVRMMGVDGVLTNRVDLLTGMPGQ